MGWKNTFRALAAATTLSTLAVTATLTLAHGAPLVKTLLGVAAATLFPPAVYVAAKRNRQDGLGEERERKQGERKG